MYLYGCVCVCVCVLTDCTPHWLIALVHSLFDLILYSRMVMLLTLKGVGPDLVGTGVDFRQE